MTRTLALAHLTVEEAAPVAFISAAAAAGFPAVGLRITGFTPGDPGPGIVGRPAAIRALRDRLRDEGLAVVTVCAYRLTPELRAADYAPVFEACAEIGGTTMLATCFIDDEGRAATLLAGLAEEAGKAGIRIGLEFFRSSELKTLAAAEALRRRAAQPNVGHIIDALHLFRAGGAPADVAALDPALIYGVQLCDGPLPGPPDSGLRDEIRNRMYPGEGALPLIDLLDAVPAHLPIEIETPKASLAGLSAEARARCAYAAMRSFLDAHAGRGFGRTRERS